MLGGLGNIKLLVTLVFGYLDHSFCMHLLVSTVDNSDLNVLPATGSPGIEERVWYSGRLNVILKLGEEIMVEYAKLSYIVQP